MSRSVVTLFAFAVLAAALSSCTTNSPTASQRAALLVHKGRERDAAQVLRDYLREHPDAIDERRLLIRVIAVTGDLGAAQKEAEILAEKLGPGDPTPWIEMGHAFELSHRYEDALSMYDRAAEIAPRDVRGAREGGMRAAAWGEAELAEPRLAEALRRDTRDAKLWHALGLVRLKLQDYDGARVAYTSGLRADPKSLENRLGLATLAVAQGNAQAALENYDAIAAARPKFGDAQLGRAWALMKLGRLDEAESAIGKAESLGGNARAIRAQRKLLARLRSGSPPADRKNTDD